MPDTPEPLVFRYEPTMPTDAERIGEEMWERVMTEGADLVDLDGNVVGHINPATIPPAPEPLFLPTSLVVEE